MNGRSLLCVAHQIAAERHGELLIVLAKADAHLAELLEGDAPTADELANTLFDEAQELLHGPRPNYFECVAALSLASDRDNRYTLHWRALNDHVEKAIEDAMERLIDAAEREDFEAELRRGPTIRGAVN